MNVAIVNPVWSERASTPEATLERFSTLTGWASALVAAGASAVHVYQRFPRQTTIERDGVAYRFIADGGLPRPPAWYGGAALDAALGAAPDRRYDIVHVNGLDHPRMIRRLRRGAGSQCAIVVQDHGGFDPALVSRPRAAWMRYGTSAADAVLVAASGFADLFRARGLVPRSTPVHQVMESSTTLRVARQPAASNSLSILWVGRLDANKDPLTVLEGFRRFLGRRSGVPRLTFVYGSRELESELRRAIERDDGLRSQVTLAGEIAHDLLPDFYSKADLFVLGSHREGSGYAVIEALACGVVPVLTDIPSFRELTDDGRVGALWTRGDAGSLADALTRVAAAPIADERARCLDLFARRFSWSAIGARAMEIYRDVSRT